MAIRSSLGYLLEESRKTVPRKAKARPSPLAEERDGGQARKAAATKEPLSVTRGQVRIL